MDTIKQALWESLHRAFPNSHIDFDASGLGAKVNGRELTISQEEVLNNQTEAQIIDLIASHISDLKRRAA